MNLFSQVSVIDAVFTAIYRHKGSNAQNKELQCDAGHSNDYKNTSF